VVYLLAAGAPAFKGAGCVVVADAARLRASGRPRQSLKFSCRCGKVPLRLISQSLNDAFVAGSAIVGAIDCKITVDKMRPELAEVSRPIARVSIKQ